MYRKSQIFTFFIGIFIILRRSNNLIILYEFIVKRIKMKSY
jgi:hypothetical protein